MTERKEAVLSPVKKGQYFIIGGRTSGRTLAMVHSIKEQLEQGRTLMVAGVQNPEMILNMLQEMGVQAQAKPTYRTRSLTSFSRWASREKILTGFIFSKL